MSYVRLSQTTNRWTNERDRKKLMAMNDSEVRAELEKHHSAAFGWAMSCCGRKQADAEDVLQTVYVKILEGKARYSGTAPFKTWLFSVIRKTAAEVHRRSMFRRLRLMELFQHSSPSKNTSPAHELENKQMNAILSNALASLSIRQREVLHLVFYEGFSLSEAAEVMDIFVGSARTHYERGKKNLRLRMEAEKISNEL
jgi:RNA polymerase sigma factor (sigma-70 family)